MILLDHIIPARRKKYKIALQHAKKHGLAEEFKHAYLWSLGSIEAALEEWDLFDDDYFEALRANGC